MNTLEKLREDIKKVDASIIKKLAQRQTLSCRIGLLKMKIGKPTFDKKRENTLMDYYEKLSSDYGMSEKFVKQIFKTIIKHSREVQR